MHFSFYHRGAKTWCRLTGTVRSFTTSSTICILTYRPTYVYLWGYGLPSTSSLANPISSNANYTPHAGIQCFNEFCLLKIPLHYRHSFLFFIPFFHQHQCLSFSFCFFLWIRIWCCRLFYFQILFSCLVWFSLIPTLLDIVSATLPRVFFNLAAWSHHNPSPPIAPSSLAYTPSSCRLLWEAVCLI